MLLKGKTAVFTGGAGGLGRAIAATFLREGARVVLTDMSADALAAAKNDLDRLGEVLTVAGDVSRSDDIASAAATAVNGVGALDIWVNNAGFTRDATMRKMTEEQFDDVVRVHLKGTWLGTRERRASCATSPAADRPSTCRLSPARWACSARPTTAPPRPGSSA
jgi:3-oxoacyl-[acyl-carrier protein] reductase